MPQLLASGWDNNFFADEFLFHDLTRMAANEKLIYHFTEQDTFERSKNAGSYKPNAFAKDGFIHCSTREQVLHIANGIAPRDLSLVLLEVETSKVPHEIIYENLEGGERLFPHIYGDIPHDAIDRVWRFKPDENKAFNWPEDSELIFSSRRNA